jgi:hypothetical protein
MIISAHPASTGGALRGRHGRWKRDAVDEKMFQRLRADDKHLLGRPSRVVLSPRRWGQACELAMSALTGPTRRAGDGG